MAKAIIIGATMGTYDVKVEYATGTVKEYPLGKLPKTVQDFLAKVEAVSQKLAESVEMPEEPIETETKTEVTALVAPSTPKVRINLEEYIYRKAVSSTRPKEPTALVAVQTVASKAHHRITRRRVSKAAKAIGEAIADKALDLVVCIEKAIESKAAMQIGRILALIPGLILYVFTGLAHRILEAWDALTFWIPEGLHRLGFVLRWRVGYWLSMKGRAAGRTIKAAGRAVKAKAISAGRAVKAKAISAGRAVKAKAISAGKAAKANARAARAGVKAQWSWAEELRAEWKPAEDEYWEVA